MKQVTFLGEVCNIHTRQYPNGRLAIQLVTTDGEPMATATVNVPDEPLNANEVLIKDYSENSGMLKALVDAGIIKDTGRTVPTGFVEVHVCEMI